MKTIFVIASMALTLAGCDQKSELEKYNHEIAIDQARRDAEQAKNDARWYAQETQSAIEQNTQALQELNEKLRR